MVPAVEIKRESTLTEYWSYTVTQPGEVKREYCKPDPGVIQSSMNAYKKQGKSIEEVQERIGGVIIEANVK